MEKPGDQPAPQPTVRVTEKLARYLAKKGLRFVLLDVAFCKSCGGAVGELFARPVKETEAQTQLAGHPKARRLPCELATGEPLLVDGRPAEVVVLNPAIGLTDQVTLDLRRVFGIADIQMRGASYG